MEQKAPLIHLGGELFCNIIWNLELDFINGPFLISPWRAQSIYKYWFMIIIIATGLPHDYDKDGPIWLLNTN